MKQRIGQLLNRDPSGLWIGTFHSLSARLLRREAELLGFSRRFTIYDEDDRLSLIRRIWTSGTTRSSSSRPRRCSRSSPAPRTGWCRRRQLASSSPFDRLTQVAADVLRGLGTGSQGGQRHGFRRPAAAPAHPLPRSSRPAAALPGAFSFILVDEFQDTNRAQYELIRQLGAHGNVAPWATTTSPSMAGAAPTCATCRSFSRISREPSWFAWKRTIARPRWCWMPPTGSSPRTAAVSARP